MPCFEDKLLDLLPPIYRERDTSGDLRAFLAVPAATLDEVKSLIDRLPDIWDVDLCDPRFLPLLASIVGYHFDPTRDPDIQRGEMREVVEVYRRKGTIPAIRRALANTGWQGDIEETFHSALRLNRRARIAQAKLPGEVYSLGVYRIESRNIIRSQRETLVPHHPAGTRVYFRQWLSSVESMEECLDCGLAKVVTALSDTRPRDAFIIGRDHLNSDCPLSKRQATWSYWRLTDQVTLTQGFERAGILISRWHGRATGHKLNGFVLNTERLLDVALSERRLAFACEVETEEPGAKPIVFRLVREHLNRSKLARSTRSCRFVFRQKDMSGSAMACFTAAANLYTVTQWPQE